MVEQNPQSSPGDKKADPRTVDHQTIGRASDSTARRGSSFDPLIGRTLGEYKIRRVIGRGGMGSVYEAFHSHLHRPVAIKVLAPHLLDDPRAIERFRREMRAIGSVSSPYIVQALDASLTGDVHYLVMELIDGVDADELVRNLHGIPVEDACEIVRQAALGLEDAHQHQLVHRDIKPKNLAIGRNGKVKILDLGLALCKSDMVATGRLTAHAAIGSYQYMAPEQFDDSHEVDIRADIYSLGCTLFHLLTGHPPFSGERYRSLTALMEAHRTAPPPAITEFNGMVQAPLVDLLSQLLAKRPEDRIQTPAELAERVTPYARGSNLASLVQMSLESDKAIETDVPTVLGNPSTDDSNPARLARVDDRVPVNWTPAGFTLSPTETTRKKRRTRFLWVAALGLLAVFAVAFGVMGLQTRQISKERKELADFIELAPGLNGNWWVDETPWLLPGVRAASAAALRGESTLLPSATSSANISSEMLSQLQSLQSSSDVETLQTQLNGLVERLVAAGTPMIRDSFFLVQRDDPETIDESKLRGKLDKIAEWHKPNAAGPSPLEWHTQAIALHKQGRWSEAEAAYKKSLEAFDQLQSTSNLMSLASTDYGELLWLMGRYDDAALRFRVAVARLQDDQRKFPEFVVYALGREADCLRKSVDTIPLAQKTLERADQMAATLPPDHPLRAHIAERRAWLTLDAWRIDEAIAALDVAIPIRQRSIDANNHRAQAFLFLDQQGRAMAERLRGNADYGEKLLESLSVKLAATRSDPASFSPKQRSEIRNRQINVYERLADVPLFGQGDPTAAREPLERALEFATREAGDDTRLSRHIDRIRFKLAIALTLAGATEEAAGIINQVKGQGFTPLEIAYQDLARLTLSLAGKDKSAAGQLAQVILRINPDEAIRDDIEFSFLASKILYQSAAPGEQLERVLRREGRILAMVRRRAQNPSILRYLRPHYDAMIARAYDVPEIPPEQLAGWIRGARTTTVEETRAGLAFQFLPDRTIGVLLEADGTGNKFTIPWGYRALEEARGNPDRRKELLAQIPPAVVAAHANLDKSQIIWDDPVRGIAVGDWPEDTATP